MVERAAGRVRRDEEDVVAHGALAAVGRRVDDAGARRVRHRRDHRGRAAAVERHRGHAAELDEPHRDGGQRRADAVARAPPVDGVEHERAVGALPDGGARRAARAQTAHDRAVLHQQHRRAEQILHVGPRARVPRAGGDRDGQLVARPERQQRVGVARRLQIGGQDVLALGHGGIRRLGQHLVHGQRQRAADGQRPARDGADHVHAALAGAGGVAGIEVAVVEEHAVVGEAQVVERVHAEAAPAVHGDPHRQHGVADDRRAVRAEAHGAVRVAAHVPQHAARHRGADGQPVFRIVVVAVHARHDAQPLRLERPRRRRDRGQRARGLAVGDDGRDARIRRVDDVVLLPQVGVAVAPERAARERDALVQRGVLRGEVMPQRVRRAGGEKAAGEQRGGERQRERFVEHGLHGVSSLQIET